MAFVSLTRLSLMIQERLSKLHSGNLTLEELDELRELSNELNERIIILQYKAQESQLLKQADSILKNTEPVKEISASFQEPVRMNFTQPVETKAEVKPVEIIAEPIKPVEEVVVVAKPEVKIAEKVEVKPATVISPAETIAAQPVSAPAKQNLVDRMQKTKIDDLKTAIGLNQKFLFMNFLFEGENNSYNDAIEKLNGMPTAADARHYIRELAYIYSWNYEDENVVLFTEFVERRHL